MAAPRKTTPRKTTMRKPTRAEVAAYVPEPEPVDAIQAEAVMLDADWMTVTIGGTDYRIAPIVDWPGRTYDAITETGVMSADALAPIVHPDDVATWSDAWGDLRVGDRLEAITQIMSDAGQSLGGSRASRRSLPGGRRK